MDDAKRYQQGMKVRRAVLGDEHVDRAIASTPTSTATSRISSHATPGETSGAVPDFRGIRAVC